jgi:hypothetical protein
MGLSMVSIRFYDLIELVNWLFAQGTMICGWDKTVCDLLSVELPLTLYSRDQQSFT